VAFGVQSWVVVFVKALKYGIFFLFQFMVSVHIRVYAPGETLFNHQLRISFAEDPLPVNTYIAIHVQSPPDAPKKYVDATFWRRVENTT
jgi:hypothetical protein